MLQTVEDGVEVPFRPSRVILQDFTGVPAVVDFAAMRDAVQVPELQAALGRSPPGNMPAALGGTSVADPDPGSGGAFLTSGSGIRDNIPDPQHCSALWIKLGKLKLF